MHSVPSWLACVDRRHLPALYTCDSLMKPTRKHALRSVQALRHLDLSYAKSILQQLQRESSNTVATAVCLLCLPMQIPLQGFFLALTLFVGTTWTCLSHETAKDNGRNYPRTPAHRTCWLLLLSNKHLCNQLHFKARRLDLADALTCQPTSIEGILVCPPLSGAEHVNACPLRSIIHEKLGNTEWIQLL